MFHVVLHEPEIPGNTGNIIRLCANAGCRLHLIEPLGFRLDHRSVRRSALDYDELAVLRTHASFAACRAHLSDALAPSALAPSAHEAPRWFAIETGAARHYSDAHFRRGDVLLFGSETRGLPAQVLQALPATQRLSVPMRPGNRSLNLSNCVALVIYEAWRQSGFDDADAVAAPNRTPV